MPSPAADQLSAICLRLPEATTETVDGEEHIIFRVRKRTFAYYLHDHHGDGEIAASFKVEPGMNQALIEADPDRFFMPSYLGPRGWVAARINDAGVDWDEIADLIEMSFRLVAPVRLARIIDN